VDKIINEEEISLYGKQYKQIAYNTGETILKRFDEKSKMWVILKFQPDAYDDTNNIEMIKTTTKNALINTIHLE